MKKKKTSKKNQSIRKRTSAPSAKTEPSKSTTLESSSSSDATAATTELQRKLKPFIIQTLRRASYRWYARTVALKKARVARGEYVCAMCKVSGFKVKGVKLDHIEPVIDVKTGFTGWDDYIARMFCGPEGFQVLCDTCHKSKTTVESELRKHYRKLNKEK